MPEKKLFLLDGNALVYRAHFAFISRPLINSKGVNTSAITGFVRTLWDLMKNQKPTHIAVAFDPKGETFRHEYFPEYKANRDAQPEDISIAGFDDLRLSAFLTPPLTTVNAPTELVGRTATRHLFDILAGREVKVVTLLPTEIVIRRSCGCYA